MNRLYLKVMLTVDALQDQCNAWMHLIPPATGARNITERHMKIMDSYINSPQIHANAVKNHKMLGGPFIDYGGTRIEKIKKVVQVTKERRAAMFELSAAISELDGLLRNKAKGYSLQPL